MPMYPNPNASTSVAIGVRPDAGAAIKPTTRGNEVPVNPSANPVTISRIRLSWPRSQGDLKRVFVAGGQVWNGSDAPTSADIASGWISTSTLTLGAGQAAVVEFAFKSNDNKDSQRDYGITIDFAEGCNAQF